MTPIEVVEIICVGIAALVMATDEALRRSEHISARAPNFRLSGALRFLPAALVCIAAALFIGNEIGGPKTGYILGAFVFMLTLGGILKLWWSDRSQNRAQRHAVIGEQMAQRPRTANKSVLREFAIGIDPRDQNAYVSFVPSKFIPRLQVCLDQSGYGDGMPAWTSRHRSILKTLQDPTPGLRYNVAMTSLGERQTPNNNENFLKWDNTNRPVAPSGMYRGRVALIVPDEPEIRRYFFAVPFHHQNLGRTALQIIDQSHFSFVEEWEAEDHG